MLSAHQLIEKLLAQENLREFIQVALTCPVYDRKGRFDHGILSQTMEGRFHKDMIAKAKEVISSIVEE